MEKKVYISPAIVLTYHNVMPFCNSNPGSHDEQGNGKQLSRRHSRRRQDWDDEDEEYYEDDY